MEKRVKRSRTLHGLLLGYLLHTGLACAAAAVLWFGAILAVIETGFVLPAYSGSDAALRAMEILPEMSAEHFDASALPELCRWVVLDTAVAPGGDAAPENVLATNMDSRSLELALGLDTPPLYTQFYRDVPLIDGTLCRLQYDFAIPYADPALRGVLPDFPKLHDRDTVPAAGRGGVHHDPPYGAAAAGHHRAADRRLPPAGGGRPGSPHARPHPCAGI